MKIKGVRIVGLSLLAWGLIGTAQAALIDRGNGLIYDDVLDITWLHDANYAKTSGYIGYNGMTWDDAMTWAAGLEYGGYDDWRLPTAAQPDSSCSDPDPLIPHVRYGCTGSEMGYMFYTNLGGMAGSSILSASDPNDYLDLFDNLGPYPYWSSTEYALNSDRAWGFGNDHGSQFLTLKYIRHYVWTGYNYAFAWAVRSGDVAVVPVPGTALLLGTGLVGLLGVGRQQWRR